MRKGFTIIELMMVVVIIAIIAAIAIPSLLRSQMSANETSAVGMLRTLVAAQSQFRGAAVVDQDSDGTGEYGFLQEMAGSIAPRVDPRVAGAVLNSVKRGEYVTQLLGNVDANFASARSGYLYFMYLPDGAGAAIGQDAIVSDNTKANVQENRFVCYAWPETFNASGKKCFVVNQQGEVYAARNNNVAGNPVYDGAASGAPLAHAAFSNSDAAAAADISGGFPNIEAGELGVDGQIWVPAGG